MRSGNCTKKLTGRHSYGNERRKEFSIQDTKMQRKKYREKKLSNEGDVEGKIKDKVKNRRKSVGNRIFLRD